MTVPQPPEATQDEFPDPASTQISLHAEYLPNIRQVTLYVSLLDSSDPRLNSLQPEIYLSESRRAVTVSYPAPFEDISETIKLPARVSEAARVALERQVNGQKGGSGKGLGGQERELSFRMQIDASDVPIGREEMVDEFVPWTAGDLSPMTKVGCRECQEIILNSPAGSLSDGTGPGAPGWIWKDLPSGNWAEMMDFWHCHKPDPHKDDEDDHDHDVHSQDANGKTAPEDPNAQVKGYGAANRVIAIPGTVLVDVSSFLVSSVDCLGLKKVDLTCPTTAPSSLSRPANIICTKCGTLIGMEDIPANGWRLLKANLAVNSQPQTESTTWETLPVETVVAAQLLELTERESARRFAVHCGEQRGLLLWVFNPNLRYSHSSLYHSTTDQQAMKVFIQVVNSVERLLSPESGTATPLSVEELELPETIFKAVVNILEERNGILPISARIFREWKLWTQQRHQRQLSMSSADDASRFRWSNRTGGTMDEIENTTTLLNYEQWPAEFADPEYRRSLLDMRYHIYPLFRREVHPFTPANSGSDRPVASNSANEAENDNAANQGARVPLMARFANFFRKKKATQNHNNEDIEAAAANTDVPSDHEDNERPSRLSRFGTWVLTHLPLFFKI